jgi:uncharacterized membrane-anchored protein YhcB (DUF1043 family)
MSVAEIGVFAAGLLTLCIFSFLYKDNPFYRTAEHLYVGVSTGYLLCRNFNDVFMRKLYSPLLEPGPGASSDLLLLVPLFLGILMVMKLFPSISWVSRWSIAFVVGGTIGLSITARFKSDVTLQVKGTIEAFQAKEISPDKAWSNLETYKTRLVNHKSESAYSPLERIDLNYQVLTSIMAYLRTEAKTNPKALFQKDSPRLKNLSAVGLTIPGVFQSLLMDYKKAIPLIKPLIEHHSALFPILKREIAAREAVVAEYVRNTKTDGVKTKKVIDELHALQKERNQLLGLEKQMQENRDYLLTTVTELEKETREGFAGLTYPTVQSEKTFQEFVIVFKKELTRHSLFYSRLNRIISIFTSSYDALSKIGLKLDRYQELSVALDYMEKAGNIIENSIGSKDLTRKSLELNALSLAEKMETLKSEAKVSTEGLDALNIGRPLPDFEANGRNFNARLENFMNARLDEPFDSEFWIFVKAFIIACAVLTILVYFFFSTEHKGAVGVAARTGIYFLMVSFGASFGYTIMARISLLIGRMDYLIVEWPKSFIESFSRMFGI